MDPNVLFEIPLFKIANSNNWMNVPVRTINDESFFMSSGRADIIIKDEDLKPNKEGKFIINIEALDLKFFYPNIDLPKEFEMPLEVLEARKEKRRLKTLEKDAVFIDRSVDPIQYFYIEDEKLRILQGKTEIISKEIEIKQNHKVVPAQKLNLGFPYLVLPEKVLKNWEPILNAKELKKLKLIPAPVSLTDCEKYYKLNQEVEPVIFNRVKSLFIDWGEEGLVTCRAKDVSTILKIPIDGL